MSRCCRAVKLLPSVTMYCRVASLLFSIVGLYTSDSTPSATVYHAFDPVFAAVPKQSFLAVPMYDWAPGPPGAAPPGAAARPEPRACGAARASDEATTATALTVTT